MYLRLPVSMTEINLIYERSDAAPPARLAHSRHAKIARDIISEVISLDAILRQVASVSCEMIQLSKLHASCFVRKIDSMDGLDDYYDVE